MHAQERPGTIEPEPEPEPDPARAGAHGEKYLKGEIERLDLKLT